MWSMKRFCFLGYARYIDVCFCWILWYVELLENDDVDDARIAYRFFAECYYVLYMWPYTFWRCVVRGACTISIVTYIKLFEMYMSECTLRNNMIFRMVWVVGWNLCTVCCWWNSCIRRDPARWRDDCSYMYLCSMTERIYVNLDSSVLFRLIASE